MQQSAESIQTVESNDNHIIPVPSAPESDKLPPSYYEAVNFETENKTKMLP